MSGHVRIIHLIKPEADPHKGILIQVKAKVVYNPNLIRRMWSVTIVTKLVITSQSAENLRTRKRKKILLV